MQSQFSVFGKVGVGEVGGEVGGGRLEDQGVRTVSCGNWTHFSCVFTFQKSSDCVASCEDPCSHRRIDIIQVMYI